jgi:hypothetical protein
VSAPLSSLLVTVLDLTRVLSGPYCTMLLADMGARVIKVEQPGRGDDTRGWGPPFVGGESAYFLSINRNKQSLTLDLKHPAARRVLDGRLDRADVLVENFRPGTMERLGLGYEQVTASRPRLIYCSISGFGQTGPRRDEPGYDAVMQAEGGLMSITGRPAARRTGSASPSPTSSAGCSRRRGSRSRSTRASGPAAGSGGHRDARHHGGAADLPGRDLLRDGVAPGRLGNRHPTIVPYETVRGERRRLRRRGRQRRAVEAVLRGHAGADVARLRTPRTPPTARASSATT